MSLTSFTIATERKLLKKSEVLKSSANTTKSDNESRKMLIKAGILDNACGSSFVEIGATKVVCSVNGLKEQSGDSLEGSINVMISGIEPNIRFAIQNALNSVVCLKKIARAQVDVEINVLIDDGGALAAALIASSIALVSANIECFDIILACHFLQFDSGRIVFDPELEKMLNECLKLENKIESNNLDNESNFSDITIGIAPSLGQVLFLDVNGGAIKKSVLSNAIKLGFDKCLEYYPLVSKIMHEHASKS